MDRWTFKLFKWDSRRIAQLFILKSRFVCFTMEKWENLKSFKMVIFIFNCIACKIERRLYRKFKSFICSLHFTYLFILRRIKDGNIKWFIYLNYRLPYFETSPWQILFVKTNKVYNVSGKTGTGELFETFSLIKNWIFLFAEVKKCESISWCQEQKSEI
jgi:hypothetical protein